MWCNVYDLCMCFGMSFDCNKFLWSDDMIFVVIMIMFKRIVDYKIIEYVGDVKIIKLFNWLLVELGLLVWEVVKYGECIV